MMRFARCSRATKSAMGKSDSKSFDGLSGLVRCEMNREPRRGDLFVFVRNKKAAPLRIRLAGKKVDDKTT